MASDIKYAVYFNEKHGYSKKGGFFFFGREDSDGWITPSLAQASLFNSIDEARNELNAGKTLTPPISGKVLKISIKFEEVDTVYSTSAPSVVETKSAFRCGRVYANSDNNYSIKLDVNGTLTTDQALQASIDKWALIEHIHSLGIGKINEGGINSCGLCSKFCHEADWNDDCKNCLVKKHTELTMCKGTPYIKYAKAVSEQHGPEELRKLAKDEKEFLIQIQNSRK